jgi:hypothetical protein
VIERSCDSTTPASLPEIDSGSMTTFVVVVTVTIGVMALGASCANDVIAARPMINVSSFFMI